MKDPVHRQPYGIIPKQIKEFIKKRPKGRFYDRMIGVVVTNRYFTEPAIKLASKLKIILWDRDFIKEFQ
ncbi:MAG: restriction endonuclease [Lachnospiraceae bacterium]|nr:restriction endonuclease [Lachnospiraceae bacterium]